METKENGAGKFYLSLRKHLSDKPFPVMKKYLYFALAVLYACSPALAQNDYPTETDLYVFWQPDRPLTPADFQKSDSLSDRQKRISDAHALYCVGCFGLWTQADAPKGKWTRKRTEVVYIAPAFEKRSSFILHGDTAGIVHEQLLFDLQEVGARLLRYKLEEIKKEADRAVGIQAIVLNTCKAKVREFVDAMSSSFVAEVLIEKNDSLARWRALVDDYLEKYADYATRPEDCARFALNRPLLDGYSSIEALEADFRKRDSSGTYMIKQGPFPDTGTPVYKNGKRGRPIDRRPRIFR